MAAAARIPISFEFFPPRTSSAEETLWETVRALAPLQPDFVSVTYGAGGSTRDGTIKALRHISGQSPLAAAGHITCVNATKAEVDAVVRQYADLGLKRVVALRGDPVGGPGSKYEPHPEGYQDTADLVAGIRRIGDFTVAVAAYPERHPESQSFQIELDLLKRKVDAGAALAITQFFYDNDLFDAYVERVRAAGITIPIVPGIMPIHNIAQVTRFAAKAGATVPAWVTERFVGLDDKPDDQRKAAISVAVDQVADLLGRGVERLHFYALNRHELLEAVVTELGLAPTANQTPKTEAPRRSTAGAAKPRRDTDATLRRLARDRILILDGAMGTQIQGKKFDEAAFRGERFKDWPKELRGNNDLLVLTQPEAIYGFHKAYLDAGADIIETNTFSSTSIAQADYAMESLAYELNLAGAKLARAAADAVATPEWPRFVAGALGPTNKTASMSPNVADPGYRAVTFDDLRAAYRDAIRGLIDGGSDLLLFETITDTLNVKAGIFAAEEEFEARGYRLPIMISGTITDLSGRTLSGQTPTALWHSVRHAHPVTIGLNCALGPKEMRAHIAELSDEADTLVCAYPNAGLPNAFGGYDETPDGMAAVLKEFAETGLVNIVGGCCGTTPAHIARIREAVDGIAPRAVPRRDAALRLSGLEPVSFAS